MISNALGAQLHDRYTRGHQLTHEEQLQLEQWYQQQDMQEAKQLNQGSAASEMITLQTQIERSLQQLATSVQRVQQITAENDRLRQEVSVLRQQLTQLRSA